ncbi:MAG: lytic transglycosylase domain-containing protein [Oligoflexales bacterium]|nr:lytic transglycosylase domain-containing protein [Oligoflexales bacterium]
MTTSTQKAMSRLYKFAYGLVLTSICFTIESPAKTLELDPKLFPTPPIVEQQIQFWGKVFYHYPTHATVIHDTNRPDHIIDIIDFKVWAEQNNRKTLPGKKLRDRITRSYLKRYRQAIKRFRRLGKSALKFGAIERRVFSVYKRTKSGLYLLYRGKVDIRSQGGLADEFIAAANRAQQYLPYMEATFKKEGVPPIITRLAFVESMFNLKARSRVGASGVWQFMPQTAKKYMRINRLVDERNSPFKATRGAARLLARNYHVLDSWPLAITAYNHGQGGMKRAIKQVGSKDLGKIIDRYSSSSFRYASQNFYAEFRAAVNIYKRLLDEKKVDIDQESLSITSLSLKKPLSIAQILKKTPLKKSILSEFNRCLRASSFTRYRHHKLPKFFEIFIPKNLANKFQIHLATISERRYAKNK